MGVLLEKGGPKVVSEHSLNQIKTSENSHWNKNKEVKMLLRKRFLGGMSLALVVVLIGAFIISIPVEANPICCQVWGYSSGSYSGSEAYLITKYISIFSGQSGSMTSVTDLASKFIEAGYGNIQGNSYAHPYASWQDVNGYGSQVTLTNSNLLDGGLYHFRTQYRSGNLWDAYYYPGTSTVLITEQNLGTNLSFPKVMSGGESTSGIIPLVFDKIGPYTTKYNAYYNGNWLSWCYSNTRTSPSGTITACNSTDHSWTVQN
jgi:hypothetical protein